MATGKERFAELLNKQDYPMITSFKQTYIDALKQYYFVGGMPEAVQSFAENKDFNEVREIQKRILAAYEQDFSKHAPNEIVPKIRLLWTASPRSWQEKTKSSSMASFERARGPRIMKRRFCGFPIADWFIRSAV